MQEELQLQSLLNFVKHSLATQSDLQIVASKQELAERRLNKAVSQNSHAKFDPLESAEITFKKDTSTVLEHCKNLGMVDCSFLHQKFQLTACLTPFASKKTCCELNVQHKDGSPLSVSTSLICCQLKANKNPQPAHCTITETGP